MCEIQLPPKLLGDPPLLAGSLTNQRDASRRVTANPELFRLIREECFGKAASAAS